MRQGTSEEGFLKENGGVIVGSDNARLREKFSFLSKPVAYRAWQGQTGPASENSNERGTLARGAQQSQRKRCFREVEV